ncbi:hypothetical protein HK102_006214 [Quaeritorhiza haematococci]|nr:hypothetical protein HK102_006214 [Quaeritorhiza haematococci]
MHTRKRSTPVSGRWLRSAPGVTLSLSIFPKSTVGFTLNGVSVPSAPIGLSNSPNPYEKSLALGRGLAGQPQSTQSGYDLEVRVLQISCETFAKRVLRRGSTCAALTPEKPSQRLHQHHFHPYPLYQRNQNHRRSSLPTSTTTVTEKRYVTPSAPTASSPSSVSRSSHKSTSSAPIDASPAPPKKAPSPAKLAREPKEVKPLSNTSPTNPIKVKSSATSQSKSKPSVFVPPPPTSQSGDDDSSPPLLIGPDGSMPRTHRDAVDMIVRRGPLGKPIPGVCQICSTRKTGQWRRGPAGPRTLCNGCGLAWAKRIKLDASRRGISVAEAERQLLQSGS